MRDVDVYRDMMGRIKFVSQGKVTMRQSDYIDVHNKMIELSPTIKINYDNVELEAGVIHLNDVKFLTSTSRHVNYRTTSAVDNMKASTLETGLKSVVGSHDVRGF